MIFPGIDIPQSSDIHLYQKPIRINSGEKALTAICRAELKREPEINELFLFYNHARDTLKLFWRNRHGSQTITRMMSRGGFVLPAPQPGQAFVTFERKKLDRLFRASGNAPAPRASQASEPEDAAAREQRKALLESQGFVEIDLSQLNVILNTVSPRPERPSRSSPGTKKTSRRKKNVLPFPSKTKG